MNSQVKSDRPSVARNVGLWVLQILTAAAFLVAGFATLSGQPMMVETFEKVGVGQWFRYVTGAIEVGSAILLLIPRLTPVGRGAAGLHDDRGGPGAPAGARRLAGAGPRPGLLRRAHPVGPVRDRESMARRAGREGRVRRWLTSSAKEVTYEAVTYSRTR